MMHISQIWQYPVKSMIGGTVDRARLVETGMADDRTWAVRDEVRGGIRGAKKIGNLMKLAARHDTGGAVVITLPDGTSINSNDDDADARVSAAIDHPVTLWPLAPADDLDFYRRGAADSDDIVEEMRGIFGREEGEPLPDFSIFPPIITEFESPPGTYLDAFPLMIMSTSALRSLQQALPDSAIDVRRFRPSFVIDTGDETGHPEFGWSGRSAAIGDAVIQFNAPCPRCVMVTREVSDELPQDRRVLRHVVKDLDQNLGVYATVTTPGAIAVGDEIRFLD
jgi:uncharacterized protein YcbX